MAAAAAEAFTNDLLAFGDFKWKDDATTPRLQFLTQMLHRLEESNAPLMAKIEAAYFALAGVPLPRGREPFQSLKLLIDIRNRIVHCRPATLYDNSDHLNPDRWTMSKSEERFYDRLVRQKLVPSSEPTADWMDGIANRWAAIWAIATAADSTNHIVDLMEDDRSFQEVWGVYFRTGFEKWFTPFRGEL